MAREAFVTTVICEHPDRPKRIGGLCKSCYDRHLRITNPGYAERQRENYNRWKERHPERLRAAIERRKSCPEKRLKDKTTKRRYRLAAFGTSPEEIVAVREFQGGKCAICTRSLADTREHVDHCHDSGRFRGLLCNKCNNGLGWFDEDPEMLRKAVSYLEQPTISKFRAVAVGDNDND